MIHRDKIAIIDIDGNRYEDVRASVQRDKIYTRNATVPVEIGYLIERKLRSGKVERFEVTDAFLWTGGIRIPDYYEITYKREGARTQQSKPRPINVHISDSPQSHVNIDSEDHSINISYADAGSLFDEIRELLQKAVEDSTELESLLEKVDVMEGSQEAGGFKDAYVSFMSAAANHMTVLAPVLPALAGLLS